MENINLRILDIFEQKLGIDKHKITSTSNFAELGLDEIDKIMLIVCLEDAFEIMIQDADFAKIDNVVDLTNFIHSALKSHTAAHNVQNS